MSDDDLVRLKCVLEAKKLRIRIISKGYHSDANCQFPKDIRVEGREYLVPRSDITMDDQRGKYFYRVRKNNIKICDNTDVANITDQLKDLKVYGLDLTECCVCLSDANEFVIIAKCGHYCVCKVCAAKLEKCPICRGKISQIVTKDMLQ